MDKPVAPGPKKKPYLSPVLTVYGTIRELTQKVGPSGGGDGGSFPKFRTKA
jgi:hypothetical protein